MAWPPPAGRKEIADADARRALVRQCRLLVIETAPSPWRVTCDGCGIRARSGGVALGLGADVHLCRICLPRAREVVDEALVRVSR